MARRLNQVPYETKVLVMLEVKRSHGLERIQDIARISSAKLGLSSRWLLEFANYHLLPMHAIALGVKYDHRSMKRAQARFPDFTKIEQIVQYLGFLWVRLGMKGSRKPKAFHLAIASEPYFRKKRTDLRDMILHRLTPWQRNALDLDAGYHGVAGSVGAASDLNTGQPQQCLAQKNEYLLAIYRLKSELPAISHTVPQLVRELARIRQTSVTQNEVAWYLAQNPSIEKLLYATDIYERLPAQRRPLRNLQAREDA